MCRERTADLTVENGTLVNVFTGELMAHQSVVIADDTIQYVGNEPDSLINECTKRIDAAEALILPGFIDAHNHLDSFIRNDEWARYLIPTGCTTVVTEMAMAANAAGPDLLKWFMESGRSLPLRIYYLVPPSVPPFPYLESSHEFPDEAFSRILREPDVVGLGEAYWPMILSPDHRVLALWQEARIQHKTREGHTAGAHGRKLQAYKYLGATSCHESISWEEALEKARLGYSVMIREGFVRKDLDAVAPIHDKISDFRSFILVSDVFDFEDLLAGKGMQALVSKSIRKGFDPVTAVQMASINPASYFGLHDLGAISPGRKADLLLADSFEELNPGLVIIGGKIMARNGKLTSQIPEFHFPPHAGSTIEMHPIIPADLCVTAQSGPVRVRTISIDNDTITRELLITLDSVEGKILASPEKDVAKLAVFHRHQSKPAGSVGFVHGTGLKRGAFATTITWDTGNIIAMGVVDSDMVTAVNRLIEIGGGWIVCCDGEVLTETAFPIFGLISDLSMPQMVNEANKFVACLRSLGMNLSRPLLTLQTVAFTGLPFLRLTDKGLVDIRRGSFVPLIATDDK